MTRDAHDGPDPRPTYLRAPSLPPQTKPTPSTHAYPALLCCSLLLSYSYNESVTGQASLF